MRLIKIIKPLIILFLITSGCEPDRFHQPTEFSSKKTKLVSYKEVSKNKKILKKLNLFYESSNSYSNLRAEENSILNFKIITSKAQYFEYGDYHSFTFPIIRQDSNNYLENLLFSLQSNGEYKSYLLRYDLNDNLRERLTNGQDLNLNGKISVFPIDDETFSNNIQRSIEFENGEFYDYDSDYCYTLETVTSRATGWEIEVREQVISCPWHESEDTSSGSTSGSSGTSGTNDGSSSDGGTGEVGSGGGGGGSGSGGSSSADSSDGESDEINLEDCIRDLSGNCINDTSTPIELDSEEADRQRRLYNLSKTIEAAEHSLLTIADYKVKLIAVGEYFNENSRGRDFEELDQSIRLASNGPNLSLDDYKFMFQKAKEIYDILKPHGYDLATAGSIDTLDQYLTPTELSKVEKNATIIAFLPEIKAIVGPLWPQNADEWSAIGTIMGQYLLEIGLAFIPGSSIVDVVSGVSENDYIAVTIGIAGLVVDAFGGTILKGIAKIGRVAYKTFKVFRLVKKHLDEITRAINNGIETLLDGDKVKLIKNGTDEVGEIVSSVLRLKYSGFGGDVLTSAAKTTTVLGRYIDNTFQGTKKILDSKLHKYGENKGGLNLLDEANWNNLTQNQRDLINKNWLEDAFRRGDDIRLVSDPITNKTLNGRITQYGKELDWILEFQTQYNYYYNPITKMYVKN